MAGIVSWGAYIPRNRITSQEITSVHGGSPGKSEKSVASIDEDAVTLAVEASRNAIGNKTDKIGAVFFGSESHPYAVKPTGTIVAEALGLPQNIMAADLEFACKAGSAALQILLSMVQAGSIEYGLGGGTDTAQGAPGEPLEHTAAAGSAVFIIGKEDVVAEITESCSFTTDTPDFWRRQTEYYPKHAGWFTGGPAYFRHVQTAAQNLMQKANTKPEDYDFIVLHQPNGKFPRRAAQAMGFSPEQVEPGMVVDVIGNTYSASSLLGLIKVLEQASPGQQILFVSYGSGAGSDCFHIEVTEEIKVYDFVPIQAMLTRKKYLTYGQYITQTARIS